MKSYVLQCNRLPLAANHVPLVAHVIFIRTLIFAVVLTCFFTIPAELMMIRLPSGLEHGRVYAIVGGVTISDPDTVSVMF